MIYLSILAISTFVSATEAPLVGRPREHFYNAIGQHVRVELSATPTDVRAEDELTLSIQISGAVNSEELERPDLRTLDEFASRFHINDLDEGSARQTQAGERNFRYRLRPKNERVREIPPLLFRYYDPKLHYFPTTVSNSIPLQVHPRTAAEAIGFPMQEPEFLFHIVEGPAVLSRQSPRSGWPEMLLAFLVPGLVCAGWYAWWRYRHPNEAKLAHLRQCRAVRQALDQLSRLDEASPQARTADQVVSILRTYLQQRLDLPRNAGTSAEIGQHLASRQWLSTELGPIVALFDQCDALRFGPPLAARFEIPRMAENCIVAMEEGIARGEAHSRGSNQLWSPAIGIFACLALGVASSAFAAAEYVSEESDLEEGVYFFHDGVANRGNDVKARASFRLSAISFTKLRQRGSDSPGLHLNEGNARLLSGDPAGAILAYHRGLRLKPDDPQLRQALEYARSHVEFSAPEDRLALAPHEESLHWPKYVLRKWGIWLTAVFSLCGWLALMRWRITRERTWAALSALALLLAVLAIAGRVEEFRIRALDSKVPFGAVRQSVILRKGDGPSFAPRRENPLPAGTELTIRQERGAWLQVQLADGSLGWLPRDFVAHD
ncbi:MAG TPA: hypothetical protein VGZ47_15775 [Gemmataceae bacterium]|nr:hypothetical protein [Gemmataceae bacterium]